MSDYWIPAIGQLVRIRLPISHTSGVSPGGFTHPRKYRVMRLSADSDGRPTACLDSLDAREMYTNWLVPLSPLEQLADQADG